MERKIGDIFVIKEDSYVIEPDYDNRGCVNCECYDLDDCFNIVGLCDKEERSDNTGIIAKRVVSKDIEKWVEENLLGLLQKHVTIEAEINGNRNKIHISLLWDKTTLICEQG